jgi:hypothetical protein
MDHEGDVAAKLDALSIEHGAGATVWSQVIEDNLAQHVKAREQIAQPPNHVAYARYHGTALIIVVAVDQILRFEHRVRQLTGDADLQKARQKFDAEVGSVAKDIRDIAMHLDDYALGQGNRQTGKQGPAVRERHVRNTVYWTDLNESYVSLGGDQLSVERTARAAIELAGMIERARVRGQKKAMERWNKASNLGCALPVRPSQRAVRVERRPLVSKGSNCRVAGDGSDPSRACAEHLVSCSQVDAGTCLTPASRRCA